MVGTVKMAKITKPLTDTEIKRTKYTSKEEYEKLKSLNPPKTQRKKIN